MLSLSVPTRRLVVFARPFVSLDDAGHERMAHDVTRIEAGDGDAAHVLQNLRGMPQAAWHALRKVDLRDVARNDGARPSSKKSFCAFIEVNGERKAKYKRLLNMKISGEAIERLEEEGFRGPVRKRQRPQPPPLG